MLSSIAIVCYIYIPRNRARGFIEKRMLKGIRVDGQEGNNQSWINWSDRAFGFHAFARIILQALVNMALIDLQRKKR